MGDADYTIVVPLQGDLADAQHLLQTAATLLPVLQASARGRVIGLAADALPAVPSPTASPGTWPAGDRGPGGGAATASIEVRRIARAGAGPWARVVGATRDAAADLLLFDWRGWTDATLWSDGGRLGDLVRAAPCDLAAVKLSPLAGARRVLLPVRGGPHALLTLRLATGLAERLDATITALHIERPDLPTAAQAAERAQVVALLARGPQPARVQPAIVVAESVESAIVEEARGHDVVIMGATPGDAHTPYLFGPIAESVMARLDCTVVVVKTREPLALHLDAAPPLPLAAVDRIAGAARHPHSPSY